MIDTALPELVWPAVPKGPARLALSLLFQLEQSQWWPPEKLRAHQMRQISALMSHAGKHVPYYRDLFAELGIEDGPDMARDFHRLPLLPRHILEDDADRLHAERVPPSVDPVGEIHTSGTSGHPVVVRKTLIDRVFYNVISLRDILWHRRDLSGTLAVIKVLMQKSGAIPIEGVTLDNWGDGVRQVFRSGPAGILDIRNDVPHQVAWLKDLNPDYVLTNVSNAVAIAQYCAEEGIELPKLSQVIAIGEAVSDAQRAAIKDGLGVSVADMYTCQELGYLALQAPDHPHYLVQAENVFLEVLDDDDKPCAPGEIGRVVLTGLHNFATPLIRYDIGDLAEVGGPCPSGRGLPTLNRVLGRVRNMIVTPEGRRVWPDLPDTGVSEIAPVKQFQITQKALDTIDMTLVCARDLTGDEEEGLRSFLRARVDYPFTVDFHYAAALERAPNGKVEAIRSALTPDQIAAAMRKKA